MLSRLGQSRRFREPPELPDFGEGFLLRQEYEEQGPLSHLYGHATNGRKPELVGRQFHGLVDCLRVRRLRVVMPDEWTG